MSVRNRDYRRLPPFRTYFFAPSPRWTLGILIHELLSGHAPFDAKEPMETYQKIIRGVSSVPFPYRDRDPEACDLVKQLLRHCPSERLPMKSGGVDNLKKHPWYSSFDWKGLEKQVRGLVGDAVINGTVLVVQRVLV